MLLASNVLGWLRGISCCSLSRAIRFLVPRQARCRTLERRPLACRRWVTAIWS